MRAPMIIPPPMKHSKKCDRCGLLYDENEDACTHCKNLSDEEVIMMTEQNKMQHESNKKIGLVFLVLCIVMLLVIFLI